jgi:predicted dehydrogenase
MHNRGKISEKKRGQTPKGLTDTNVNVPGSSDATHTERHSHEGTELSRRDLCSGAIGFAAFSIIPRSVLGGKADPPPSERLNIAVIGTGCHGTRHIRTLLANQSDVQVVAVCDVNRQSHDYRDFDYKDGIAGQEPARGMVEDYYAQRKRSGAYSGCAAYRDFRSMLDKEKNVEAVVVATPDHTHAVVAMQAIKVGKHVYCEKPLTHSIYEARKLAEAARAAKVATQMGNQYHAHESLRYQVEVIRSGVIGQVQEVHAWSADAGWHGPWSPVRQQRWAVVGGANWSPGPERPQGTPPVPDELDWDLWLGPAAYRPYHPAYLPFKWRGWWAFGSGALGDMGCHIIDAAFWALELQHPVSVEARSSYVTSEAAPAASIVYFKFPGRGDRPPVKLTWYDGGLRPSRPEEMEDGRDLPAQGLLYVGDKGKLLAGFGGPVRLLPESLREDFERPAPFLPRILLQTKGPNPLEMALQHREWIDNCKGGSPALSDFAYSGPLTETVLLGTIAIRTREALKWDGPNMKVTNLEAANEYVRVPYRQGWAL